MSDVEPTARWLTWTVRLIAVAALVVAAWACATQWGGVRHGHPAYPAVLAVTAVGAALTLWRTRRPPVRREGWRRYTGIALVVLAVPWVAAVAWLRPLSATEPAVSAVQSGAGVAVEESAVRITMTPAGVVDGTGVFFQPGAKVDARAYAAILRPLAEAGHLVVIAKQPLGIAFLATGAFDGARDDHPEIEAWVVGGHSLGGVVAAMEADDADEDATAPAVGLVLYGSYPADDISRSLTARALSVSGSRDGLSTPAKIDASRADLPADTTYVVIEGGTHAYFGDYGTQSGDGTATISHDRARQEIADATVDFVEALGEPAS